MARLYTTGFEWNQSDGSSAIDPRKVGAQPSSVQTSVVRSGTYAGKCDATTPGLATFAINFTSVASRTYYVRVYYNFTAFPTSGPVILCFNNAGAGTWDAGVLLDNGQLNLWDNTAGAAIGSKSAALSTSTWYRVEFSLTTNSANHGASAALYFNGALVSSGNVSVPATVFDQLSVGWFTAPNTGVISYLDDIAVNDSTGTANTTYPGDGKVALLLPASDNARVGWTNDAGGTTSLFDDVNNTPPVGVATPAAGTQIKVTTNNTTDTYDANVASYSSAGVTGTVNAVTLIASHGYSAASAATLGLQGVSNPAVTEVTGATNGSAAGVDPANWANLFSVVDAPTGLTLATQPVVRVRHGTASATNSQFVDALGVYVDYAPGVYLPQTPQLHLARTAANF